MKKLNETQRLIALEKSRLSVRKGNDVSCVYFNSNMILVMLEMKEVEWSGRVAIFYRPNTYDYVVATGVQFDGNFCCQWGGGTYVSDLADAVSVYNLKV